MAAIIGGVIGGLILIMAGIVTVVILLRRHRQKREYNPVIPVQREEHARLDIIAIPPKSDYGLTIL